MILHFYGYERTAYNNKALTKKRYIGFDTTNKSIYELMTNIDKDKSGQIEFDEFLSLITSSISDIDTRDDIMHVFNLFDMDQKGLITVENLKNIAEELGEEISEEEIRDMVARADTNADNGIDRDEFYAIMTYGRGL